jgi:PleD family two-component response regulator
MSAVQRIHVIDRPEHIELLVQGGLFYYPAELSFSTTKREAVVVLSNRSADLIISGLEFEDGNAMEMVQQLRKNCEKFIPGIYLSDPKQGQIPADLMAKLGAIDVVQRPVDFAVLNSKLDRALTAVRQYRNKPAQPSKEGSALKSAPDFALHDLDAGELENLIQEARKKGVSLSEYLSSQQPTKG